MSDTTPTTRRGRSKKFLQEITEPEVQETVEPEKVELQEIVEPVVQESFQDQEADVNWDDLNDRQREEIIQNKRAKDDRLA